MDIANQAWLHFFDGAKCKQHGFVDVNGGVCPSCAKHAARFAACCTVTALHKAGKDKG